MGAGRNRRTVHVSEATWRFNRPVWRRSRLFLYQHLAPARKAGRLFLDTGVIDWPKDSDQGVYYIISTDNWRGRVMWVWFGAYETNSAPNLGLINSLNDITGDWTAQKYYPPANNNSYIIATDSNNFARLEIAQSGTVGGVAVSGGELYITNQVHNDNSPGVARDLQVRCYIFSSTSGTSITTQL